MKKITAFIILIVLVCALSGCAEVWYSVTIDDYGARTMELKVNFNSEDADYLRQKEAVTALFTYIAEDDIYATVVNSEDGSSIILRKYYSTQTEYEIAVGITGDELSEPAEYNDINFLYHEYVGTLNPADKATFVSYAMTYLKSYYPGFAKVFLSALKEASDSFDMSKGLFSSISGICADESLQYFNEYLKDEAYSDELSDLSYNALKNIGYDYSQVEVFFQYSHAFKSVYAKEYDDSYKVGGQTAYVWKLDPLSNNEFTIYQKTPVVWVWELIGIGLGILAIAVVFVVVACSKESKTDKKDK